MPYAPRHLPTEGQGNTENWEQLVSFRFKGTALEGGLEEPTLVAKSVGNAQLAVPYTKGTGKLSFTASKNSATLKVVHGLGKTPTVVVATSLEAAAFEALPTFNIVSLGATEFSINGEVVKALTGEPPFMWLAVA